MFQPPYTSHRQSGESQSSESTESQARTTSHRPQHTTTHSHCRLQNTRNSEKGLKTPQNPGSILRSDTREAEQFKRQDPRHAENHLEPKIGLQAKATKASSMPPHATVQRCAAAAEARASRQAACRSLGRSRANQRIQGIRRVPRIALDHGNVVAATEARQRSAAGRYSRINASATHTHCSQATRAQHMPRD